MTLIISFRPEAIQMSRMLRPLLDEIQPRAPSFEEARFEPQQPAHAPDHGPPLQMSAVCIQLIFKAR